MSDEHEFEPVYGLPEALPEGERILWQGEPTVRALAHTVFFSRALVIYFSAIIVWQSSLVVRDGGGIEAIAGAVFGTAVLGSMAVGLAWLFARLYARTTVYTITNRRIALRFGLAVPLNVNLPFRVIESAAVRKNADGSGDLTLRLVSTERVGYVQMWPCVQRWRFTQPRPALRAVENVDSVAAILADALARSEGASASSPAMAPDSYLPTDETVAA